MTKIPWNGFPELGRVQATLLVGGGRTVSPEGVRNRVIYRKLVANLKMSISLSNRYFFLFSNIFKNFIPKKCFFLRIIFWGFPKNPPTRGDQTGHWRRLDLGPRIVFFEDVRHLQLSRLKRQQKKSVMYDNSRDMGIMIITSAIIGAPSLVMAVRRRFSQGGLDDDFGRCWEWKVSITVPRHGVGFIGRTRSLKVFFCGSE